jgi:hypothetical protein
MPLFNPQPSFPWQFSITSYGAAGDVNCVVDGAMNASAVLTSASGLFTAGDVGKTIAVKRALTSGTSTLVTTIASYQSATQVTLTAAATVSSATGLQVVWGTDDTAAIQAAINAAIAYRSPTGEAAQVVSPLAPGGFGYMVAGALKTTDGVNAIYNSQLTIGLHSDRKPGLTLEFAGPTDAGIVRHWNQDYPAFTGATWFSAGVFANAAAQSSSVTASGNPSCLGGPTGKNGYGVAASNPVFNNITPVLRNMSIMNAYSASGWTYSPFNFHGMARAHLIHSSFGTSGVVQYYTGGGGSGGNTDFSDPSTFSAGISIGGLMPAAGSNASSLIQNCVWNGGYTYGPLWTEHSVGVGVNTILYNWSGFCPAGNYGDGGTGAGSLHAIDFGQLCVEACTYHVNVFGGGAAGIGPYLRGSLDTEGAVQVRDAPSDGTSLSATAGEVHLTGGVSTPSFTFPTGLRLVVETQASGPVATPSYTLGTAQINTYGKWATVLLAGGTTTAVKVSVLMWGGSAPAMTTVFSGALPSTPVTIRIPPGAWWEIDGSIKPTTNVWTLD